MTHGFRSRLLTSGRRPPATATTFIPERVFGEGPIWARVPDTSTVPWRSICHLEITYPDNSTAFGSGWFAGPDTVITAGHNVFSHDNGGWAQHVRVVPGRDGNFAPFDETYAVQADVLPGWEASGEAHYDLGMLKTADARIGRATGWFGYAVFADDDLAAMPLIQSAGYPAETRPFATQWYDAGRAQAYSATLIKYRVDTEQGQSGAPIFFSNHSGQRWVVATHVYHAKSTNLGLRVTAQVFAAIDAWTAQR